MTIFEAIEQGNSEAFESCLGEANLSALDARGFTPLHCAVLKKNAAFVRALLAVGADARVLPVAGLDAAASLEEDFPYHHDDCYEPILLAAKLGDVAVFDAFLETDASLTTFQNHQGMTPLMVAALSGQAAMTNHLLESGVGVLTADREGYTALHWSVECSQKETARLLALHWEQEFFKETNDGLTAMGLSVVKEDREMIKLLHQECAVPIDIPEGAEEQTTTPLHLAIETENESFVVWFLTYLEEHLDSERLQEVFEKHDKWQKTPLMAAAQVGDHESLVYLVETGEVDIDAEDDEGHTAFFHAIENHNEDAALYLFGQNAEVEDYGEEMDLAISAGMVELIKAMLMSGMPLDDESLFDDEVEAWFVDNVLADVTPAEKGVILRHANVDTRNLIETLVVEDLEDDSSDDILRVQSSVLPAYLNRQGSGSVAQQRPDLEQSVVEAPNRTVRVSLV